MSSATRHVFRTVTDLEAGVGRSLGTTEWLTLDQCTVSRFATLTGDDQWIHVDVERATSSPFGGTIVHGYLTLSLLPAFAASLYSIEAGSARLNYGVDKVRFPSPLAVGARIRASPTITRVRRTPAGAQMFVRWVVEADGNDRPVCVAETITLVVG